MKRNGKTWGAVLCAVLAGWLGWLLLDQLDNRCRQPRPIQEVDGYAAPYRLLAQSGLIFLCEGWAFYPGLALKPTDFLPGGRVEREELPAAVPEEQTVGQGGTYRLVLRVSAVPQGYLLELPGARSGEFWINGSRVGTETSVFTGPEGRTAYFEAADRIELLVVTQKEPLAHRRDAAPPALGLPGPVHSYLTARLLACILICSLAGLLGVVVPSVSFRVGAPELGLTFLLLCAGCLINVGGGPLLALWPGNGGLLLARKLAPYLIFFALEWISGILCGLCDSLPVGVTYSGLLPFGLVALETAPIPGWLFAACEKGLELYIFFACAYLTGAAVFSACRGRELTLPLAAGFSCMSSALAVERLAGPYYGARLPELFSLCAFLLLLIFTGVLCTYGVRSFHRGIELAERERTARRLLNAQKTYYADLMRRQKVTREFQHEVRHKLFLLQYYLENSQWNRCLHISRQLLERTVPPQALSANPLINALLTDFSAVCADARIDLAFELTGLSARLPYADEDLCCLLMNLFQNAVEACEKLPPGQKRCIRLVVMQGPAALRIQCGNSKRNPVKRRGERLLSDKPQAQDHGFGLALVQRVVKKYGGDMRIEYTDQWFSLWAVLPIDPTAT